MKLTSPFCFQFMCVFFFRRALYACAFVVISEMPSSQVIFLVLIVLAMTGYLLLIRPYVSPLSSILSVTNEILLLFMIITCFRFVEPAIEPKQNKMIGSALVYMLILTIVINWAGIMIYGVIKFTHKRQLKAKKDKKAKIIESRVHSV